MRRGDEDCEFKGRLETAFLCVFLVRLYVASEGYGQFSNVFLAAAHVVLSRHRLRLEQDFLLSLRFWID